MPLGPDGSGPLNNTEVLSHDYNNQRANPQN